VSKVSFAIEGFDEIDIKLASIGDIVSDRDRAMPIMLDALEPVAERARQIAPVRTGRLRDDIVTSETAEGGLDEGITAYVGPSVDAFYAEDVEFGRPASISPSGREWDAVDAQPFMRPAWDAEESAVIDRLGAGLRRIVSQAAKG
jgi:HK97 gp10 family phage protein